MKFFKKVENQAEKKDVGDTYMSHMQTEIIITIETKMI